MDSLEDSGIVPGGRSGSEQFRKFVDALQRKWWIPAITVLVPVVIAFFYLRNQPVQEVSKATMWVRGKLRLTEVGQITEDAQNYFGTQIQLLQSDQLRQRAMERVMSMRDGPAFRVPRVRVSQAPKSAMFHLECYHDDSEIAKTYLNALMDEFLAYRKEVRMSTSSDALASISAQVYKQEQELKLEQEKLVRFQRENNVALLEENLRGGGTQLGQLNAQASMLNLELQLLDAAEVEHNAGVSAGTNAAFAPADLARVSGFSSPISSPSADYTSTRQQIQTLKMRREKLGKFMRPVHPKIVKLDEEIARAEKLISIYQTQNREQLNAAREAMRIRVRSISNAVSEVRDKVGDANRRLAELEGIKAGIQRQQSFYDRLLALLQGVDLNSTMNQEDVAILERASDARRAPSQMPAMLAAAGAGGFGLGLGIVFLLARLDDRCRSLPELRDSFPEEVVGQLPDVSLSAPNGHLPLLRLEDDRHTFAESCRNLRSSLLFGANGRGRPRTILVTSALPSEGKSTIALNLAVAMSMGGADVLLIDGDLRRGHLHEAMGVQAEPGLSDYVRQHREFDQCAIAAPSEKLCFLPRGKATTGSSELFLSPGFEKLIKQAKERFDFIVIDSTPVFAADDAPTLAPKMDAVLFVVRSGYTSTKQAREALGLLYQRDANVLGLVFNRVDAKTASYRYDKFNDYYYVAKPA